MRSRRCPRGFAHLKFDPGIYGLNDIDHDELEVLNVVSDFFKMEYPGHKQCPVIRGGDFQVVDSFDSVSGILFDSGAIGASYISKQWMDEHRDKLTKQKRLRPSRGRVRLADNGTNVDVHERFRTLVTFPLECTGEVM